MILLYCPFKNPVKMLTVGSNRRVGGVPLHPVPTHPTQTGSTGLVSAPATVKCNMGEKSAKNYSLRKNPRTNKAAFDRDRSGLVDKPCLMLI
jgi:hypothetical protein